MTHSHDNKLDRFLMYMLYEAGKFTRLILILALLVVPGLFTGGIAWLVHAVVQAAS